jgi:hypothetical protein
MQTLIHGGAKYFCFSSLMISLSLLLSVSFAINNFFFKKFQVYRFFVENQTNEKSKILLFNNSGEINYSDFNAFCEIHEIGQ